MSKWKEGDRVQVIAREVTDEDRKKQRYYSHMAGLVGTIQSVYGPEEVSIKIEPSSLTKTTAEVHKTATIRMREKLASNLSEEQKKGLTAAELDFDANFMLLVRAEDLQPA